MTTIDLDNLYNKAVMFATEKHKRQKRLDGQLYITHPVAISEMVDNPTAKIIALLHDTLEDTDTTVQELHKEFGYQIARAVIRLTKFDDETYEGYISEIKKLGDPIIISVKIADLKHNLSTIENIPNLEKRERLRKRYVNALKELEES